MSISLSETLAFFQPLTRGKVFYAQHLDGIIDVCYFEALHYNKVIEYSVSNDPSLVNRTRKLFNLEALGQEFMDFKLEKMDLVTE